MPSAVAWDPDQYQRFKSERNRPFFELVERVGAGAPATVADLGCGPGDLTETLLDRWPSASVVGVDSSALMLSHAAALARPPRLTFAQGDIESWRPPAPVDVIVTNAALQWLPDHLVLLSALVDGLTPRGWLALQVPGNLQDPHHQAIHRLAHSVGWRDTGAAAALSARPMASHDPEAYVEALSRSGCVVDAWATTYIHVLQGEEPVLEWIKGTALRPVLSALGPEAATQFCAELAPVLRAEYPARAFGTPFPFRRVFAVAQRNAR